MIEQRNQVIFYGAGENAYANFDRWYESGLAPVCFVDADQGRQNTYFSTQIGKLKILPLVFAIEKFPDYLLYLTQEKTRLADVTEYLLSFGIPKERIRYCDGFAEPGYCNLFLEQNFINIESDTEGRIVFAHCCGNSSRQQKHLCTGDFYADYKRLIEHSHHVRQLLKEGYYNRCYGCSLREKDQLDPNVKRFAVSSGIIDGEICNFKCVYCGYPQIHRQNSKLPSSIDNKGYNISEILHFMENKCDAEEIFFEYCAGEIGAQNRHNDEVLRIWNKNKWRGMVASNSSVFLPGIASLLEQNLLLLLTSLDSGTSETFAKIRGVDLFDKVIENLGKYAATGGEIVVKYILLEGMNDSKDEIDKFLSIVEKWAAINSNVSISLSRDLNVYYPGMTTREIESFRYMVSGMRQLGIEFSLHLMTFSSADVAIMESL